MTYILLEENGFNIVVPGVSGNKNPKINQNDFVFSQY